MNDLAAIVERDTASGSIAPSITTAGTHDAYAPADRRALLALLRETREALTKAHLRLETFEPPNGRGLQLPGAYALDHPPATYDGCDFCIALMPLAALGETR